MSADRYRQNAAHHGGVRRRAAGTVQIKPVLANKEAGPINGTGFFGQSQSTFPNTLDRMALESHFAFSAGFGLVPTTSKIMPARALIRVTRKITRENETGRTRRTSLIFGNRINKTEVLITAETINTPSRGLIHAVGASVSHVPLANAIPRYPPRRAPQKTPTLAVML